MGDRTPGPICTARVGDHWIDGGTNCRTRVKRPGPVSLADAWPEGSNPAKDRFDADHVYSLAPEAARKRDIDLQIIGDDYTRSAEINIGSEHYLKELISLGSRGHQAVSTSARKIQFFIVRGGAEGFLDASLGGANAGDFVAPGVTTGGKRSPTYRWDLNDLLAVFDPKGTLIRATFLQRPIAIAGVWKEENSMAVYNAWHEKDVSIYRNQNFSVEYLGLVVSDGMKHRGWVDMHKQEATNGCIFIVDPDTPDMSEHDKLNAFEPKLIHEVLATIGKTADQVKGMIHLGTMRVVDLK
jgi:hypothetical protein